MNKLLALGFAFSLLLHVCNFIIKAIDGRRQKTLDRYDIKGKTIETFIKRGGDIYE